MTFLNFFTNKSQHNRHQGLLVAFIGMDGTGKSTWCKNLASAVELHNLRSKWVYLGGQVVVKHLARLAKIARTKTTKTKNSPISTARLENPFLTVDTKPPYLRIWSLFILTDCFISYLLKIMRIRRECDVVVCDRYFYDKFLSLEYYGFSSRRWTIVLSKIVPRPTITFVLDVNPLLAQQRETGNYHALSFFSACRERYLEFARNMGFHVLNTERSKEANLNEVLHVLESVVE